MSGRRAIMLVARREIRERLRSRAFLVATAILLLAIGGSTAFSAAFTKSTTYRVAVTAPAPSGLGAALQRAAKPFDAKTRLRCARLGGGRRGRSSQPESRRAAAPPRGPARLQVGRRREARGGRRHGGARAPPPPAAGAGAHDGDDRAESAQTSDAEVAVAVSAPG